MVSHRPLPVPPCPCCGPYSNRAYEWTWGWGWPLGAVASVLVTAVTATHVHDPDSVPLFDVGHHVLPRVSKHVVDVMLLVFLGAVAWGARDNPDTARQTWPRALRLITVIALLQACVSLLTVVPDPRPMCHVAQAPMSWWLRLWRFVSLQDIQACGGGSVNMYTAVCTFRGLHRNILECS